MLSHDWFPAGYSCEIDPELPATGPHPHLYSLGDLGDEHGARRYVRIRRDDGGEWTLRIYEGSGGVSFAASTPMPDQCLICANGNGVLASVDDPTQHRRVDLYPVRGALPLPEQSLLILWTFGSLLCFGTSGVIWEIDDLVTDELNLVVGQDELLKVTGWAAEAKRYQIEPNFGTLIN